jgi:hypothetical protein
VFPDGFPVEIQVRTRLQHEWAELFEKLADQLGRGIRYGEPLNTACCETRRRSSALLRKSHGSRSHFLLIYDRAAGQLVRQHEYADAAEAIADRFAAEAEFAGQPGIEIVVIGAESEEELRTTHGRYFLDLNELAARLA